MHFYVKRYNINENVSTQRRKAYAYAMRDLRRREACAPADQDLRRRLRRAPFYQGGNGDTSPWGAATYCSRHDFPQSIHCTNILVGSSAERVCNS